MTFGKLEIRRYLSQGVSPEKLALALAFGVTLGIVPALGVTTGLCFLAGHLARLNQPFLQAVNYMVYPLQLLLLIPFYRAGEYLFKAKPLVLSVAEIQGLMEQSVLSTVRLLWDTTLHALAVWGLIAPVLGVILFFAANTLFRRSKALASVV